MGETAVNNVTNCNQCHNACKLEEVKCGRGEKYREYLQNGGAPEDYVSEKRDHTERSGRHGKHGGHGHHHRNNGD